MQSRRDQLQAYKFLTRRALAALVAGEPDVPEAPMRRISITTVAGVMIAVLVIAAFAVIGFFRPGTNTKLSGGTIYIERETGAQFVVLNDGLLHPTLNYPSAVLAAAGENGKVGTKTVSAGTLAKKKHGPSVGIPGAPQSLPRSAGRLVRSPWTVCSQIQMHGASNNVATVIVTVGGEVGPTPLDAGQAAVVTTPGSSQSYLLWNGRRLKIAADEVATSMGLQTSQSVIVGSSLLNALPEGPSLDVPSVPGAGRPGVPIGGASTLVGQIVEITDNHSYQIVLSDGLAPVTAVEAALLETVKIGGKVRSTLQERKSNVIQVQQSTNFAAVLDQFKGLPADLPAPSDAPSQAGGLCAVYREGAKDMTLAVPPTTAPTTGGQVSESPQSRRGVADEVDVPAETAALVAPDNGAATRFIVAAPGEKFSVSAQGVDALGYGSKDPVTLPQQLLFLLPQGPSLDSDSARHVSGGS